VYKHHCWNHRRGVMLPRRFWQIWVAFDKFYQQLCYFLYRLRMILQQQSIDQSINQSIQYNTKYKSTEAIAHGRAMGGRIPWAQLISASWNTKAKVIWQKATYFGTAHSSCLVDIFYHIRQEAANVAKLVTHKGAFETQFWEKGRWYGWYVLSAMEPF